MWPKIRIPKQTCVQTLAYGQRAFSKYWTTSLGWNSTLPNFESHTDGPTISNFTKILHGCGHNFHSLGNHIDGPQYFLQLEEIALGGGPWFSKYARISQACRPHLSIYVKPTSKLLKISMDGAHVFKLLEISEWCGLYNCWGIYNVVVFRIFNYLKIPPELCKNLPLGWGPSFPIIGKSHLDGARFYHLGGAQIFQLLENLTWMGPNVFQLLENLTWMGPTFFPTIGI